MSEDVTEEFSSKKDDDGNMCCIDCGAADQWMEGPSGGMCTNYQCGRCGARFNIGPGMAERIGFNDELRAQWQEETVETEKRSTINRRAAIEHTRKKNRKPLAERVRGWFN